MAFPARARITRLLLRLARAAGVRAYRVMSRPLAALAVAPPAGIAIRPIGEAELIAHCADSELGLSAAKSRASFSRGEVCIGAFDGAKLAGYAWFAFQPAPHTDGLWMDFDRRAVYTYRAFVRPGHRGRGIAPALYRCADAVFLERGRSLAILCIELGNRASLVAAERSGARFAGFTFYVRTAGRLVGLRSEGVRKLGYRFYLPLDTDQIPPRSSG